MSDALCRAVAKRKDLGELKKIAVAEGFKEMFHDGLLKIKEGRTTLSEVIRVSRGATNAAL
jgi:general secretion pathway protein E